MGSSQRYLQLHVSLVDREEQMRYIFIHRKDKAASQSLDTAQIRIPAYKPPHVGNALTISAIEAPISFHLVSISPDQNTREEKGRTESKAHRSTKDPAPRYLHPKNCQWTRWRRGDNTHGGRTTESKRRVERRRDTRAKTLPVNNSNSQIRLSKFKTADPCQTGRAMTENAP